MHKRCSAAVAEQQERAAGVARHVQDQVAKDLATAVEALQAEDGQVARGRVLGDLGSGGGTGEDCDVDRTGDFIGGEAREFPMRGFTRSGGSVLRQYLQEGDLARTGAAEATQGAGAKLVVATAPPNEYQDTLHLSELLTGRSGHREQQDAAHAGRGKSAGDPDHGGCVGRIGDGHQDQRAAAPEPYEVGISGLGRGVDHASPAPKEGPVEKATGAEPDARQESGCRHGDALEEGQSIAGDAATDWQQGEAGGAKGRRLAAAAARLAGDPVHQAEGNEEDQAGRRQDGTEDDGRGRCRILRVELL